MEKENLVISASQPVSIGGLHISNLAKSYVQEALDNNRLSYGPFSKAFENAIAKEHGVKHGCFMNSGTDALRISLHAMRERFRWKDGDEVLVPAITFVATVNIVIQNNLKPVFVDVDPHTYNINPKLLESRITSTTRAIIPVHLMGLPCDMDPIMAIARKHRLRVLEDCCEAMFATYHNKKVGSFGDVGAFSTYVAHYLVTGVGGLAATSSRALAIDMRSLMNHGRDPAYLSIDDDNNVAGDALAKVVQKRFKFTNIGYSSRCTEMEAALGFAQMEEKDEMIAARRTIATRYYHGLKDLSEHIQLPVEPEGHTHVFMLYPIVLRQEAKSELVQYLEGRHIETRDLMPILSQPIYKKLFGRLQGHYPIAHWLDRCGFYIGCHQNLSRQEQDYVIEILHEYFRNR